MVTSQHLSCIQQEETSLTPSYALDLETLEISREPWRKILICDLEATCWRPDEKPQDAESEIIEIGWAWFEYPRLVPGSGTVTPGSSIAVKPSGQVSEYCTDLTGLSSEILSDAPVFADVLNYVPQLRRGDMWASFGMYDYWMLRTSCNDIGEKMPFGTLHINIKSLFHALYGGKKVAGLHKALASLNMDFIGKQHTAGDDALNAARVLKRLLSS